MLSSRPTTVSPAAPKLPELLSTIGVKVRITEDHSVDPAMLLVVQEAVWPYPEEVLLCKRIDEGITLYDLIKVIDTLGFPIVYEELK